VACSLFFFTFFLLLSLLESITVQIEKIMSSGKLTLVTPGERLGHVSEFNAGTGTYTKGGYIHASIVGAKSTASSTESEVLCGFNCKGNRICLNV